MPQPFTPAPEFITMLPAPVRSMALAAEASVRNADLTPEEADAIADEIGDEAKRRVARRAAMS